MDSPMRPPAVTLLNTVYVVFLFVKGLDGRIYVNLAEYGHAFSGWFSIENE